MAVSGRGEGWGAFGIDGNQPGISRLPEDVVDVIEYGDDRSHGVAELLDVGCEVIEGLVVA